jgi:hypothetical protein
MTVTALPPSFNWKLKIVYGTLILLWEMQMKCGEVARSPIPLGSYL